MFQSFQSLNCDSGNEPKIAGVKIGCCDLSRSFCRVRQCNDSASVAFRRISGQLFYRRSLAPSQISRRCRHTEPRQLRTRTQFLKNLRQCPSVDVTHGIEVNAFVVSCFKDVDDIGMVKKCCCLNFIAKPLNGFGINRSDGRQHFDGHLAAGRALDALIDDPHSTPRDLPEKAEVAKDEIRTCLFAIRSDNSGESAEQIQLMETFLQLPCTFRILSKKRLLIRSLTGILQFCKTSQRDFKL